MSKSFKMIRYDIIIQRRYYANKGNEKHNKYVEIMKEILQVEGVEKLTQNEKNNISETPK